MNLILIEELAGVMARTTIDTLEYSQGGTRIRLERNAVGGQIAVQRPALGSSTPVAPAAALVSGAAPTSSVPTASTAMYSVLAGMSGTFYGAPAPGEAPFVKVGDIVKEGQVVAVVEAMKMLNLIEADVAGRVVRVVQAEGTAVSSHSVLFEIEPQGACP